MTFIRKIFDLLNMDNWENQKEIKNTPEAINNNSTKYNRDDYYKRMAEQRENNLKITYDDVACYNLKPFDLNKPFISDGYFTAIEFEGENLEKAYRYLQEINNILKPFCYLYVNADIPSKIDTDYSFFCHEEKLPISHLRLSPYTATMKKNKYPFWLWLSNCNDCGTEYVYMIYFNQNGEIGKADLHFHGSNGARLSYESKIRRNENGLYVMRINKTLYVEPYGTKIIYHFEDDVNFQKNEEKAPNLQPVKRKQQSKYMSKYDIERYAIECNAYVTREERIEQNKDNYYSDSVEE